MSLTRSRKIVLVILAVAAIALLVDRLVLAPSATGPKHARAAPTSGAGPTGNKAASAPDSPASPGADTRPRLADRLQTLGEQFEMDPDDLRDGFIPADAWLEELVEKEVEAPPPPPEPEVSEPQVSAATQFAEQHTLTSVILTSSGGSAVIDGKVVPVGQAIDGFRLIRLTHSSAVFEAGDETVELRLRR